jgi:hypothetical protein
MSQQEFNTALVELEPNHERFATVLPQIVKMQETYYRKLTSKP